MQLTKTINDPVHGTIGITELEAKLISTQSFQRLRSVKHLSLAYLVYPSANFSRFSHCIGVCHVTGLLLESIKRNSPDTYDLTEKEEQTYRLAGLFHDIGHYPFSHPMENAVKNFYSEKNLLVSDGTDTHEEAGEKLKFFDHEQVGKFILENDAEILAILEKYEIKPEEIHQIFNRETPPKFANLISSDFDADRIDYLLRTAHHTGLPYGKVDINYLISQLNVGEFDDKIWLYLNHKALKAADHFLLGRYFDNQQAAFHKTVASFEWLLIKALEGLLKHSLIECDDQAIKGSLEDKTWLRFDDDRITHNIHELANLSDADEVTRLMAHALVNRKPPKLLIEFEELVGANSKDPFKDKKQLISNLVVKLSDKYGIDKALWKTWSKKVAPTKVGANVNIQDVKELNADKLEQAIRIFCPHQQRPVPIVELRSSLMSVLSNYNYHTLRLYVLLPPDKKDLLKAIKADVIHELD